MPTASDAQVPKPLTYTLMYHLLWAVMFLLSGLSLMAVFLASHRSPAEVLLSPVGLLLYALIAAIGALATYAVRVQVLLGQLSQDEAFRFSAASSWAVIVFAPVSLGLWRFVLEPIARQLLHGGREWPTTATISGSMFVVEVIVWWLSHLLSVRGLARGRKKYLGGALHPAGGADDEASHTAGSPMPAPHGSGG